MAIPTPTIAPLTIPNIRQGIEVWVFCPTVANLSVPLSAEMTAGTAYQTQIAGVAGWSPTGSSVDIPVLSTKTIGNTSGTITMGTGTLTFNLSKTPGVSDARSVFNDGTDGTNQTTGVWYRCPEGIVASAKMKGYAVTVMRSTESVDMAALKTLEVEYSIQQTTGYIAVPTV